MFGEFLVFLLQELPPEVESAGGGDNVGDFIGQLAGPLGAWCGLFALLLIAGIAYVAYNRQKDTARRRAERQALSGLDKPEDHNPATRNFDTGDLPDLDMLLDSTSAADDPPPAGNPRPGVHKVRLHDGETTEAAEVVSILRDNYDGRLIIQMGDQAYRTLADAPEAKQRFMAIMKELAEIVTKPDTRASAAAAERPKPAAEPESPAPAAKVEPAPPAPEPVKPPPRPAPAQPPKAADAAPGDLPSFKLDDHPVTVTKGALGRMTFHSDPVPELDIAGAIETYLQHKLAQTPEYAGRDIHVHSAPGGGVRIQVDETFYDAVGDVTDAGVREFLSATIQEWQDRQ